MKIYTSSYFQKKLKKLLTKSPQLKQKVRKQLTFLKQDIMYPSFKMHKLQGKRAEEYSIWIEANIRILFVKVKDGVLLTDVVTHDEY